MYFVVPRAPRQSTICKVHHAIVAAIVRSRRIKVSNHPNNRKRSICPVDFINRGLVFWSNVTVGRYEGWGFLGILGNSRRQNNFASANHSIFIECVEESVSLLQGALSDKQENLPSR